MGREGGGGAYIHVIQNIGQFCQAAEWICNLKTIPIRYWCNQPPLTLLTVLGTILSQFEFSCSI